MSWRNFTRFQIGNEQTMAQVTKYLKRGGKYIFKLHIDFQNENLNFAIIVNYVIQYCINIKDLALIHINFINDDEKDYLYDAISKLKNIKSFTSCIKELDCNKLLT